MSNSLPLGRPSLRSSTVLRPAVASLFLLSSLVGIQAQTAAASGEGAASSDDVLVLEQFTVSASADRGYLASNALSATKTDTPLRDLPINMTVLTDEFLRDLNAMNATDVLEYSPSTVVQHGGPGLENPLGGINSWQPQIQIRGTSGFFNLRNGFRAYEPPASIATQRIEVIKGPASVLYGITKPGGVVNFITKKPMLGKEETRITATAGSYDRTRGTLDYNQGTLLDGKLGLRLIGSYTDTGAFSGDITGWERAFNPSFTMRPSRLTQVTAEFEFVDRESPGPFVMPIFAPAGYPRSQVPFYARPSGPDDPLNLLPALLGLPDGYNERTSFVGDVRKALNKARKGSLSLTQRLTDNLALNAQFERQRRQHGVTGYDSTLQAAQLRLQRTYQSVVNWNEIDSYSITLSHQSEWTLPGLGHSSHKLILGAQRQEENGVRSILREYNPGTNSQRNYFVSLDDAEGIRNSPTESTGEFRYSSYGQGDSNFDLGFISYQGKFLQDRVLLSAGVTRTVFDEVNDTQAFSAAGPGAVTTITNAADANSPILGVIVRPLPWLGIFAQTSKSLNPNTNLRDGFGQPFAPERGDGDEFGIKLDPWGEKLMVTLSAFEIRELGRIVFDPNAPNEESFYLDGSGNRQPISGPDDPRYDSDLVGQNKGANTAVGIAVSKGVELEAIYSPSRAWQAILSYSYLDAYAEKDTNTNTTNYNGRPIQGSVKHQASAVAKYRFLDGRLKGLDMMFGLRYRGPLFRRSFNSDGTDVLDPSKRIVNNYTRGDVSGDLKLGYETTFWGRETTFSLNVGNLFGTERWRGFKPGESGQLASEAYYYDLPESYNFTVGVRF